jgi:hypothetical protein
MKTVYAAAALALLVNVQPALAADASIDLSELTCKKFTAYNDDNRGLIMMWFEGYHTERTSRRPSTSARWWSISPGS